MSNKRENPDLIDLVREHQAGVWRYLRFLGADAVEVEDLVQETFVAIWRSDFQHRSRQQTASYLRKVARNQLLTARRKRGHELNMVELEAANEVWNDMAEPGSMDDYLVAMESCLQRIDGRARQAIDLHYRDGASRSAIAVELGMKPDGVKTLLRRTRKSLRECVERKIKH